jgi:hypothetical protein
MASQHPAAKAEREPSREDVVVHEARVVAADRVRGDRGCVMNVCAPAECAPAPRRFNLQRAPGPFPETRFGRSSPRASRFIARAVNCPTSAPSDAHTSPLMTHKGRSPRGLFALTMMNHAPYHLRAWRDYRVDIIELFAASRRAPSAHGSRPVRALLAARACGERQPSTRWLRASCE